MLNELEHTAILSNFLTFITGNSSRLLCILTESNFTSNPVLVTGASFPVQGESKYCYFYHIWDFVPY